MVCGGSGAVGAAVTRASIAFKSVAGLISFRLVPRAILDCDVAAAAAAAVTDGKMLCARHLDVGLCVDAGRRRSADVDGGDDDDVGGGAGGGGLLRW